MSLFTDILKGLPENAVLRDKVREAEANQAKLETENAILKDDLRNAKMLIEELKQQVKELTHQENLDETELRLLACITKIDYSHAVADVFQTNFFQELSLERVKYHLERLREFGYIHGGVIGRFGTQYGITQSGRKLLLDKNLL